jgi:hypothetical protein
MTKLPTLLTAGSLRLGADGAPSDEVPIQYIRSWIQRRMLAANSGAATTLADRVLIIRAETGSGKSTTLPVAVFRLLRSEHTAARRRYRGPGVICTQPRVLTAIALANDVASRPWNPDMVLGETVGFQTGPVSNQPPAGLVYATIGVLATQLRYQEDAEIMARYRFIIVDEAHERALDSDMTLMLLRNFYTRNLETDRLPFLLLTSATFDTQRYAEYFGVGPANVIEVAGRAYPIETHWPVLGTNDYPAEAAAVALRIHEAHPDDPPGRADILIFMPGSPESVAVFAALGRALLGYRTRDEPARTHAPFLALVINREVVTSQVGDYPLVFERPERLPPVNGLRPARRIIVSTVVAETGLTIDTLRYVIDCGWHRTSETYQPWGAAGILTRPATQSRIEQRRGRAGRLFPGDFYPLYTRGVHAALEAQQLPEVISTGIAGIYLAVIREQQRQKLRTGAPPEFRVEDMALLDPPPPEAFLAANAAAVALGFVAARAPLPRRWPPAELAGAVAAAPVEAPLALARGYGLTALGHHAALFARTPMEGVRVLLAGYAAGAAAPDLVTAVAMIGTSLPDLLEGRGRMKRGVAPGALPPGAAALRAALPPYLALRTGGGSVAGALPPTEAEAYYFRARLLLADDFAEAVLMYDAFAHRIDASQCDVAAVAAWCGDVGLSFDSMLEVARRREVVIEEMIVAGLDPFRAAGRRLAALPVDEFTEGLRAVKRCLYAGLRAQLLRWTPDHPAGAAYVSPQGLRVRTPGLFTDAMASRLKALHVTRGPADELRPRWILTDQIRLMPAPQREGDASQPLLYVADTNLVSVLDGYVDPDPEFDAARTFAGDLGPGSLPPDL